MCIYLYGWPVGMHLYGALHLNNGIWDFESQLQSSFPGKSLGMDIKLKLKHFIVLLGQLLLQSGIVIELIIVIISV